MLILLISLIFSCSNYSTITANVDLTGKYNITGTLVTTTNRDPNAPQAGFKTIDIWSIWVTNNVPALKTKDGTMQGVFFNNAYHYEGQVTIYPNPRVWMIYKIDIYPSANEGEIYGTETLTYFGNDGIGNPHMLGTESWTLAGIKQ